MKNAPARSSGLARVGPTASDATPATSTKPSTTHGRRVGVASVSPLSPTHDTPRSRAGGGTCVSPRRLKRMVSHAVSIVNSKPISGVQIETCSRR